MTREELQELLDKLNDAIDSFGSDVYDLRNTLENVEDRIAECSRGFNEVPNQALNGILKAGFVPGVSFRVIDKGSYLFHGFTSGMSVRFLDATGEEHNTDIRVIAKLLDDKQLEIVREGSGIARLPQTGGTSGEHEMKQAMTEPKFTPGPWLAHTERDYSAVYADSGNIEVCYCDTQMEDDDNHTVAANAHLLAAAPEMYAYLARQLRTLNPEAASAQMIRRILAKARGEDAK